MSLSESALFTITTCLHLEGKYEQCMRCLNTLFSRERAWDRVYRCVLINEYTESEGVKRMLSEIANLYPQLECIQKDASAIGQARSINMILSMLRNDRPKYWVHWEESWETNAAFLQDAFDALDACENIGQVQVAAGWQGLLGDRCGNVAPISDAHVKAVVASLGDVPVTHGRWKGKVWPLYSLQPGIDRVSTVADIGDFHPHHNRNPQGKVDGSEFNFSHRWFCQGCKKVLLLPYRVTRMKHHVSTKWLLNRKGRPSDGTP